MKKSELRQIIKEQIKRLNEEIEPEKGPFPAEFHEFMRSMKHEFPGSDAHKIMRETLKKIGTEKGIDSAVEYVIQQFPQYEKLSSNIKKALTIDKIDKPVKFVE